MKSNVRVLLAIAMLAIAALACNAISGGGGNDVPPVDVNPPVDAPTDAPIFDLPPILGGNTLLRDDFSGNSNWGIGTDADSSVEYVNDALQFIVTKDLYFVWSTPDSENYENVHIEATALNNSTDPLAAFGILCNLQVTDTSYYFAVTVSGTYAISMSMLTQDDVVLTNNGDWKKSDLIPEGASSYRIGADCGGDGTLTLYVNGNKIDSASDTTYAGGYVGLFAWSDEQVAGTNVSFDDFLMTELP